MRRNMDLIRLLLLDIEGEEPKPDLSTYTEEQEIEHLALLIEAGLVHGAADEVRGEVVGAAVSRLTWAGHDFLAAARNDSIWRKASDQLKKVGVEVPMSVLAELLKQFLKQALGMP